MQQNYYYGLNLKGFHRLAFTEWNSAGQDHAVVCVHGLTRNGRDYDYLARSLQNDFRVACPDIVGRGKSDWLKPATLYGYPQYLADLNALVAHLNVKTIDWVGTSMGGLLGMIFASLPNSPVRKLVINDVAPKVPPFSSSSILKYTKARKEFDSLDELEDYFRKIFAPFGNLSDAQWRHMTETSYQINEQGKYCPAYDRGIIRGLAVPSISGDLWKEWKSLTCPILVVRGEKSVILPQAYLEQMQETQPNMQVHQVPNVGHAPALMDEDQIKVVHDFLKE